MQEHVFNYFPLLAELDMYLQCRRFASPHVLSLMIAWLSDLGQRCHKLLLQIVYCMRIMYYEGYKSFDSVHVHFYLFFFFG